jgi:hypothetical protein
MEEKAKTCEEKLLDLSGKLDASRNNLLLAFADGLMRGAELVEKAIEEQK